MYVTSPAVFHLLLVEDDAELASMIADFLSEHDFRVEVESDGSRACQRILREPFDVVVLDIGLPTTDGITVCRTVRSRFAGPILMLTARGDEIDEVVSLEVGADDYMAKPVRPRALLARLKVHLRRGESPSPSGLQSRITLGGLTVDPASRSVEVDGAELELTTAEFDLLKFLAENAGQVVSRPRIYQEVLGIEYDGLDRSIDLRVSRLRKKMGDDPNHPQRIKSIRGVGYLLAPEQ